MLYAMKDCANFRVDSAATGKTRLFVNYAKTTSLEFTSQQTYAMNKNVKAVRFDSNRESLFKTSMEVFPKDIIPLLFGTAYESKTIPFAKKEVLKVTGGSATLVGTPKTGTLQIYKINPDDMITHISEQTVGTVSTADKYAIAGQTLTFNTTTTFVEDGYVVCYYFVDTPAKSFTINNVTFPEGFVIYGDTTMKGTDQADSFVQFKLTNVKPQSNCSINMSTDSICTLEITWDVMGDSQGNMMTWSEAV